MLEPLTDDHFRAVIQLVESGNPSNIFQVIKQCSPEDCAGIYVASLLLQGRLFPDKIRTAYAVRLNDAGAFYELYKAASCAGISVSEIESLYDNSELPEMIWTTVEDRVYDEETVQNVSTDTSGNDLSALLKTLGIKPLYTKLKPGMCPLSADARRLRKKGAVVESYKVIVRKAPVIVNVITYKDSVSYDINTYHCKDASAFIYEFQRKFMK